MVVVVMGISGSGKAVVGPLLAEEIGCHFYNGDDFHPQENLEKINEGLPLSPEDRAPWIQSLRSLIESHIQMERQAVISCHYLDKHNREKLLTQLQSVQFVYLKGDFQTLLDRIRGRKNLKAEALQRQYELLEDSEDMIVVEVEDDPKDVVSSILSQLRERKEAV
ncbi:MAG: gluconokinase, GntK/IdnK-type [Chloroflexota bacterium]